MEDSPVLLMLCVVLFFVYCILGGILVSLTQDKKLPKKILYPLWILFFPPASICWLLVTICSKIED